MAKKHDHTHKYHRIPMGSSIHQFIWACAYPTCGHYMPLNVAGMMSGRMSVCFACSEEFVLDPDNMSFAVQNNSGRSICNICISKINGTYVDAPIKDIDPDIARIIQELAIEKIAKKG